MAKDPPDWSATVQLVDRTTRHYVGRLQRGNVVSLYVRDESGIWRREPDGEPADGKVQQLLAFLLARAMAQRVERLTGRWGQHGPELVR